jgi:Uma2 family endonuclease
MAIVSTTRMTAKQYLQLGEDPPGVRLELVNGEIAVSPSPTPEHSYIDVQLSALLTEHVQTNDLGIVLHDLDTTLGAHDVRRPDILFFSKERCHLVGRDSLEGVPDLVVEIISASSATIDRVDKFEQYRDAGVPYYWMLDPTPRTIEGYALRRKKYVRCGGGRDNEVVRLAPFLDLDIPLGKLWFPSVKR